MLACDGRGGRPYIAAVAFARRQVVISKETAELIGAVCTGTTLTSGTCPQPIWLRSHAARARAGAHKHACARRTRAGDFLLQSTTSALSSHVVTRKDKLRSLSAEQVGTVCA
jgi:hypothetical protein